MKFSTAKAVSMGILLAALAIGVATAFMFEEGSSAYIGSAVLLVILFVVALAVMIIWGRCPYCGRHLFYGLYKWKICPKCRRALDPNGKYVPSGKISNKH